MVRNRDGSVVSSLTRNKVEWIDDTIRRTLWAGRTIPVETEIAVEARTDGTIAFEQVLDREPESEGFLERIVIDRREVERVIEQIERAKAAIDESLKES